MKIHFAPIQGFTDSVYRNAHYKIFGDNIEKYYTPFIRVEKKEIRRHDAKEFGFDRNQDLIDNSKLVPQILPGNTDEANYLIEELLKVGYKEIDLNFGCPFPMIAKHHKGCGLLPFPDEVADILKLTSEYKEVRFSAKMRLGLEDANEWKNISDIINDAKLEQVTIHPRTGKQQYKGEVNYNAFAEMVATIKHPIIYNGDILTLDGAKNIGTQFPSISAIMIGRGLLSNPCLADEIANGISTPVNVKVEKISQLHDLLLDGYESILDGGEFQILNKMKTIWEYLMPEMGKKERKKIEKSKNLQEYNASVQAALKLCL